MTGAFGDHMCQQRLRILNLINHNILDLTDSVIFHISQRSAQKTIGKPQAQSLENRVGHTVRDTDRQAECQDLQHISGQGGKAPLKDSTDRRMDTVIFFFSFFIMGSSFSPIFRRSQFHDFFESNGEFPGVIIPDTAADFRNAQRSFL